MLYKKNLVILISALFVITGCSARPGIIEPPQHREQTLAGLNNLFKQQKPINGSITLAEAIARSIQYNLDRRVKLMEESLAQHVLKNADIALLPRLVTQAGYTARDKYNASSSVSLATGTQSLESSYSSDRNNFTASANMVWNLLDVGVGYAQAEQEADRTLIAQERRRKVTQNIALDVSYAFWRALAAQRLLPRMDQVMQDIKEALADSRKAAKSNVRAPSEQLNYQRVLLETQQKLWNLRNTLSTAKAELAALMNLKPGSKYKLVDQGGDLPIPELNVDIDDLEEVALKQRPELREENYQRRISANETKKAMLGMLPGLELSVGHNYDDNPYLVHQDWFQAGINLSWDLFNVYKYDTVMGQAKALNQVSDAKHLAMAMAVLTQLHLAYERYQVARESYLIVAQLNDINDLLYQDTQAKVRARSANPLLLIAADADRMAAEMNKLLVFAELQSARLRIDNSAGIDLLPDATMSYDLPALTAAIAERL